MGKLGLSLVAGTLFLGVVALSYAVLALLPFPDYGAWTGIRPLENKMRLLQDFSSRGDVDALFIGSSIVDFGFSAELFSELMSRELGREYRAFNFATGGAEPRTLPKMYRLARAVAKAPKAVYVMVPPEQKLPEGIYEGTPDRTLLGAPVGDVLKHQGLLDVSKFLWSTALLQKAPAARDIALFGHFKNLQRAVGMEAYAVDSHGDRVSYLLTWKTSELPVIRAQNDAAVQLFPERPADTSEKMQRMVRFYFAQTDIDAMEELKQLVRRDGGKLYVVSHAGAATLWQGPGEETDYTRARRGFFKALAWKLDAPLYDVIDAVRMPTFAVSDVTHLNSYGAEIFTRAAFEVIAGKPRDSAAEARALAMEPPPANLFPSNDRTFNTISALVRRPAHEDYPLLRFRMVDSLAVPPLPEEDLFLALRLPDNRDVIVPAVPIGPSEFVAEVGLPPTDRDQCLVLRLLYGDGAFKVASLNPLADYEWVNSFPRKPLPARVRATTNPQGEGFSGKWMKLLTPSWLSEEEEGKVDARGGWDKILERLKENTQGTKVPRDAGLSAMVQVVAWPPARIPGESLYVGVKPTASLPTETVLRLVRIAPAHEFAPVDLGKVPESPDRLVKVALPKSLAAGEYTVSVFDRGSGADLGRSAAIHVAQSEQVHESPKLAAESHPKLSDGHVTVRWSGVRKPGPKDWIGLFPVGGRSEDRLDIVFTRGLAEGEMQFPIAPSNVAKVAAGEFEFRLYSTGGWRLLAQSAPVTFTVPTTTVSVPATAGSPAAPPSRAAASQALPLPRDVGRGNGVRIVAERAPKLTSGSVAVAWTGIPTPSPQDWIGLFPAGGPDESRMDFVFTRGRPEGEIRFPISSAISGKLASGDYEFRLYSAGGWVMLARSDRLKFSDVQ
jgi:hypothetical protein